MGDEFLMRMDKVILKSALSTLAAIGVLYVVLIAVLCLVFPQTMMGVTYDMGMTDLSIFFADVSYNRSHEAYYAAFVTEVSISANYDDKTEWYGQTLLDHSGFDSYAATRVGSADGEKVEEYRTYIQGQVCLAKYDLGKQDEALDTAFGYLGGHFYEYNPVVALLVMRADAEMKAEIGERLKSVAVNSSEEQAYLDEMILLATTN